MGGGAFYVSCPAVTLSDGTAVRARLLLTGQYRPWLWPPLSNGFLFMGICEMLITGGPVQAIITATYFFFIGIYEMFITPPPLSP